VFVLAASIFSLGTTEFMIAGLLPTIAGDLGVSIPSAGLLISGFAIGMAVGTPLMTAATLRLPRRATLLASLLVFVLGHVLAALATTYGVLMTARIITAWCAAPSGPQPPWSRSRSRQPVLGRRRWPCSWAA
jgi:DHA1 family chloramphenicol resistance protein-like MFS transporter